MLSYQTYKVIHLASIFIFLSGAAVLLVANPPGRFWKILTGVASMLILLAGFGLLARLDLMGAIPAWAIAKMVLWAAITASGHVVAKRFPGAALPAMWGIVALASLAAFLAVFKPV